MSSQLLTCVCCRLSFPTSEQQRNHYKTDYHRFNLKRQITNLPPITEAVFNEKVKELKEKEEKEASFNAHCKACKKSFSSKNTFDTHLKSKKHLEREAAFNSKQPLNSSTSSSSSVEKNTPSKETEQQEGGETSDSKVNKKLTDDEIADLKIKNAKHLAIGDCLFCNHKAASLDANIEHMTFVHGLFIPDLDYVSDLEGLIKYLGEKVGTGNVCLFCNKMFRTCEAVQNHMASVSHWKIYYDDDTDEYDEYYDFSKSWENEGLNPDEEDDPEKYKQIMLQTGKGVVGLADDGYSLVLANGTVLGHRDLKVYYKQKFKPKDTRDSVLLHNVINKYKAIGWHTTVSKEDIKIKAKVERQKNYTQLHTSVQANKLQKYFRHQVIF